MMNDKVKQVGQLMKKHSQAYTVYDPNGLCPTLAAGMKRYGGLPTYIVVKKMIDYRAIGRERTEEERQRRHMYGDQGAKFCGRQLKLLPDGINGCITTFATKDNLIAEFYEDEQENHKADV